MIIVRQEETNDIRDVEALTRKAFWSEERYKKTSLGCDEHYIVHVLRRDKNLIKELNLVAEINGKIIGHIIYCLGKIITKENEIKNVINFGPLSVLPDYQGKGIGSYLMRTSIKIAKEIGYDAIFVFGHPDYYCKFGFIDAKVYGISTSDGKNFPAFMVLNLKDGFLDDITGRFHVSDLYNIDMDQACKFDKLFIWKNY